MAKKIVRGQIEKNKISGTKLIESIVEELNSGQGQNGKKVGGKLATIKGQNKNKKKKFRD